MATRNIKITYVAHIISVLYNADLDQFYENYKTSLKVSLKAFAGENNFLEIPMIYLFLKKVLHLLTW